MIRPIVVYGNAVLRKKADPIDKNYPELSSLINDMFDMKPRTIIERLGLLKPIYSETAAYGHFGRDIFPWEKLDRLEELKSHF